MNIKEIETYTIRFDYLKEDGYWKRNQEVDITLVSYN
jgi:hypothetical protein